VNGEGVAGNPSRCRELAVGQRNASKIGELMYAVVKHCPKKAVLILADKVFRVSFYRHTEHHRSIQRKYTLP
jgi:hypothetical protein